MADAAQRAAPAAPRQEAPAQDVPRAVNKIVAVVNGEMITSFDLEMMALPEIMQARIDPRNPANRAQVEAIMRKTLDSMVLDQLIVGEAVRLGLTVTETDIDGEVRQLIDRSRLGDAEFYKQAAAQGVDKPKVRERMRKRILQQRLMANMVGRKVVVSRDEIAKYFAEHRNTFSSDRSVRMALVVYPPTANAEQWAERIRSGKISFEDVAREVSVGPKPQEGGVLGTIPWQELDPAWHERLESMTPGQVSGVFQMEALKAQVKLLEKSDGQSMLTLEQATPKIEEILRTPKLEERYAEYLGQLRKKARVDIRL